MNEMKREDYHIKMKNNDVIVLTLEHHFLADVRYSLYISIKERKMNSEVLGAGVDLNQQRIFIRDFILDKEDRGRGIGTGVMDVIFEHVIWLYKHKGIKIKTIKGKLADVDKDKGHWESSIPFYKKYVDKNKYSDKFELSVSFYKTEGNAIHEIKEEYKISQESLDIDVKRFINEVNHGEFVYHLNWKI